MKKNEYVSPEMEIVEITGQCVILAGSDETPDGTFNPGKGPRPASAIDVED